MAARAWTSWPLRSTPPTKMATQPSHRCTALQHQPCLWITQANQVHQSLIGKLTLFIPISCRWRMSCQSCIVKPCREGQCCVGQLYVYTKDVQLHHSGEFTLLDVQNRSLAEATQSMSHSAPSYWQSLSAKPRLAAPSKPLLPGLTDAWAYTCLLETAWDKCRW